MPEVKKQPYEFLVRWGEDGKLRGAHVGFATTIIEADGTVSGWHPQPVMPVGQGNAKGYPLTDILDRLHADALIEREEAHAARDSAIQERDQHADKLQKMTDAHDQKSNQLTAITLERDQLIKQLAALAEEFQAYKAAHTDKGE